MISRRSSLVRAGAAFVIGLVAFTSYACMDEAIDPLAPLPQFAFAGQQGLDRAIEAQQRHTAALMRLPGVVGTAVGLLPNGRPAVRVFLAGPNVPNLPATLDGVPVSAEVTGLIMARSDPTQRLRPAPLGYSVGHPLITAGTIGARVVDVFGEVYILSNNHVLAAVNGGSIGDGILQPGAFDGGSLPGDRIGTLSHFEPIDFSSGGTNLIDAALARTTRGEVENFTPADDGYGMPSAAIWGDGNGDGLFDNRNALLGLPVQKYGRTTGLTQGTVTGVNATLSVCYDAILWICLQSATFVDQLVIEPGTFSDGGDSGAIIVSLGLNPVGLLFAGSATQTIANRVDFVLNHFSVAIDDGGTPTPTLDVAVTAVNAPASATEGDVVDVVVSVRNIGNQNAGPFDLLLHDLTDDVQIGLESVPGLTAGATFDHTFPWNTAGASIGSHTLRGSHTLPDENVNNDAATTVMMLNAPGSPGGIHVGDLDDLSMKDGKTWSGIVEITVHDVNHQPINGATVQGRWEPSGLASDVCTTGELGGNGSCIFLYPSLRRKRVTFTVLSITMAGQTYSPADNHDPDGDSDGTTIDVIKP